MTGWAIYLALINAVAFCVYGVDKWQARRRGARVAEIHLLGLAAAGGTLGAWCGRQVFRHKTKKVSFVAAFWVIVAVQVGLGVWYWGKMTG